MFLSKLATLYVDIHTRPVTSGSGATEFDRWISITTDEHITFIFIWIINYKVI